MTDTPAPPVARDHKSAKAEAKAAQAHAKAMRPWFKKKRFIVPIILVVIVIAASAGAGGGGDTDVASGGGAAGTEQSAGASGVDTMSNNEENPPQADVAVESCAVGEFDYVETKLRVTNNSSERSMYFIDVVIEGADGSQIESGFASVDNLEPGQSTVTDVGLMAEAPGQDFTCRIVEVERMSDES